VSQFVVVAGMSGAGRSTAAAALEDLGWFVIDNLPPELIATVAELADRPRSAGRSAGPSPAGEPTDPHPAADGDPSGRTALVVGRGGSDDPSDVLRQLDLLRTGGHQVRVLFLDAPDDVLVRRFETSRRRHPLPARGMELSIADERRRLSELRDRADVVIDTGDLNVNQLRGRVIELFRSDPRADHMHTSIVSFGFKYGVPLDPDMLLDCRFLPNPHWVEELRPQSGLDDAVRRYVLERPETEEFVQKVDDLLRALVPAYEREGKSYLTIALGCTGGRHRSVALAEELAARLRSHGVTAAVFHRDVDRGEVR